MSPDTDIGVLINPDLDALLPSPTNPRKTFDADALQDLAASIAHDGVMTPILVRELNAEQRQRMGTECPLEIVAGERRYRASRLAGMQTIPAILRDLNDAQVERLQLVENIQREGLSPLEEAEGFARLLAGGMTADEIATHLGKDRSKSYVYAKLKLLDLTDVARDWLRRGEVSESVALLVARFPAPLQGRALSRITALDIHGERPSFRAAKRILSEHFMIRLDPRTLHFDPAAADLLPDTPACTTCPTRMGTDPSCEPELADVCTDTACYARKVAAGIIARQAAQQTAEAAPGNIADQADTLEDHPEDSLDMATPSAPTTLDIAADVAQAEASFAPAPAPASTPPATSQAATRRNDPTAPLRKAWADYRDAVAEQIVSNPPLFVAGPLLREVAYQLAEDSNYHLPMDCSDADAMTVILRIVTEHLAHHAYGIRSGVAIEDLAEMVGIDHTRILQETIPVPEGCARPNENGVYPGQDSITREAGKSSACIRIALTEQGWRTSHDIKSPTGGGCGPISINSPAYPTRDEAIQAEAKRILTTNLLSDIPDRDQKSLTAWLESISTGEAEPDTTAKPTTAPIRYRHPDNPSITWTGRGKKPQWVITWIADGGSLDDLDVHTEGAAQ